MKKKILVIIPHASRKRPKEIKKKWLSKKQKYLIYSENCETDRYSEKLYNLKKFIKNEEAVFPISQVYLNICRHPKKIDEICPIDIRGTKVYTKHVPLKFRKMLIKKYAVPFYKKLAKFRGGLILNGHTMVSGHSSLKGADLPHQIVISSFIKKGKHVIKFAPDRMIKLYVEELKKRLPKIKIGINSVYVDVYDYLCYRFGWKNGKGIPMIHQETDESLYIKGNKLNYKKLNKLRKVFAEALAETAKKLNPE